MASKTLVIVSTLVDATIKEYQPDVDFKIFRTINELSEYLEHKPIRADILFFTRDVVDGASGTAFNMMKNIVETNVYISVSRVIYMTEKESPELSTLNYLIEEFELEDWEIIEGAMSRTFVSEVINGTYREDQFKEKRMAVIRAPRADYVKDKLRQARVLGRATEETDSMSEHYIADDENLANIPDVEIPVSVPEEREQTLRRVYISGLPTKERTAFSLLIAQYLSVKRRTLIMECDPEYHTLTEFVMKANIDCEQITVTDLYQNPIQTLQRIKETDSNLIVITAIDRIDFDYRYLTTLLYYNLKSDFDYLISEIEFDEMPYNQPVTVVVPSTVPEILKTGELVDKSLIKYIKFVGIDLKYLPEVHLTSGQVLSTILNDVLSETTITAPVITISSLRLGDTAYDLGNLIGGGGY